MKKMVISMGIAFAIIWFICVVIEAAFSTAKMNNEQTEATAHSYQEIAEAYVAQGGYDFDECVIESVYQHPEYHDVYMHIVVYEDGDRIRTIDVDASYAESVAF